MKLNFKDLPIRYKFLSLIAGLLTAAIALYLFLAIRLFEEDKKAFVYEGQGTLAGTLSDQHHRDFLGTLRLMRLLTVIYGQNADSTTKQSELLRSSLRTDQNVVGFALYEGKTLLTRLVQDELLEPYHLKGEEFIAKVETAVPLDLDVVANEKISFRNATIPEGIPLLRIAMLMPSKSVNNLEVYAVTYLHLAEQINTLRRSEDSTSYIIDRYGNVIVHRDEKTIAQRASLAHLPYIKDIIRSNTKAGSSEVKHDNGDVVIVSYAKVGVGGLIVVNEIEKSKAFIATTRLKEKSLYVALLIVVVSFMVSLLFTKRLTATLQRLFEATTQISGGNFGINVKVFNNDEVGMLTRSFNFMASRIVELLKETADKARMEKELETAHLVQENFFPIKQLNLENTEIATYFKSASECGGDWWGHIIKNDGKLTILIGDATGHGVPAALITAAAHSCCTTIQQMVNTVAADFSPARILATLNNTIYAAGRGQVKMTFFVAELDTKTGELRYANASHEMPIISRLPEGAEAIDEVRAKDDIDTLSDANGPILGEKPDSTYKEYKYQLRQGDVFLWYTDGLTECRNPDGEEFGESRLLRSFVKAAHQHPSEIKDKIIESAHKFYGDRPIDDDITLLVMRFNPASLPAIQQAS
jgi:sigma-B regulation protein RsbU (phosphoserine phosphatase)